MFPLFLSVFHNKKPCTLKTPMIRSVPDRASVLQFCILLSKRF